MTTNNNPQDNPYLSESVVYPDDPEQLNIRLTEIYENISTKTNVREIGVYALTDQETGQRYFDPENTLGYKNVLRKVVQIPPLVSGFNSIAHGISFPTPNTYKMTHLYGVIYDDPITMYVPLPNNQVFISVNLTNINLSVPLSSAGFSGTFVLEWTLT